MKILCLTVAVAALTAAPAFASPITPGDAAGYQGNNITVQGTAVLRPAHVLHWGMELALRDRDGNASLIAYIPRHDLKNFSGLEALNGRMVNVTGIVEMNAGQPEIRLSSRDQINVAR